MSATYGIKVGDIQLHLQRDGDGVNIRIGLVTEHLTWEQIEELRNDLDEALDEMFVDKPD